MSLDFRPHPFSFTEIRFQREGAQPWGHRRIMIGKPWIFTGSTLRGHWFSHPCIEKSMDFVKMDSGKTEQTAEKEAALWKTGQDSL